MAKAKKEIDKFITTPMARINFPNLFTPRATEEGKEEKFSCVLLFPKDADLSRMEQLAKDVAIKEFGEDQLEHVKMPFHDGTPKAKKWAKDGKYQEYNNMTYINLSAKADYPPKVVGPNPADPIMDPNQVYSGCWVHANCSVYAYDFKGTQGVSFGLHMIQKAKDCAPSERFGGVSANPEEAFTVIKQEEVEEFSSEQDSMGL